MKTVRSYFKKRKKFGNKYFEFNSFYMHKSDAKVFCNAISKKYNYRIEKMRVIYSGTPATLYGVWTRGR